MAEKQPRKPRHPKEQVTPKGTTIPVPKRADFYRDLSKVAKPKVP